MTAASLILLVAAGVLAVGDWWAVAHRPAPGETVLKPLVLIALVGVALAPEPEVCAVAPTAQRSERPHKRR